VWVDSAHLNDEEKRLMSESLHAIFQHVIWSLCYLSVLLGLSAFGLHRYFIIYLFLKNRRRRIEPAAKFGELPIVTVQLPVFNEYYVIRRLIDAVSRLDYPREKLQIQILDDSTDETSEIASTEVARLQGKGFDIEYYHRNCRTGFKAGALASGLARARGEFVFILDADFVPGPDTLKRTIDYFTDPKIGMVQMRWGHLNREYSLLTKVQSLFLDGHLLLEQTARSRVLLDVGEQITENLFQGIMIELCSGVSSGSENDPNAFGLQGSLEVIDHELDTRIHVARSAMQG
jgi:cellulose synthase/poly-beta-1,6-N-acetylglucosamine synthase-like glycosyltransferase